MSKPAERITPEMSQGLVDAANKLATIKARRIERAKRLFGDAAPPELVSSTPSGDKTDWRELCHRLSVELFHVDRQLCSVTDEDGEPVYKQGSTVRDVLNEANAALDQPECGYDDTTGNCTQTTCCKAAQSGPAALSKEEVARFAKEAGFNASIGKTDKNGKYSPYVNALGKDVPFEWIEKVIKLAVAKRGAV